MAQVNGSKAAVRKPTLLTGSDKMSVAKRMRVRLGAAVIAVVAVVAAAYAGTQNFSVTLSPGCVDVTSPGTSFTGNSIRVTMDEMHSDYTGSPSTFDVWLQKLSGSSYTT